MVGSRQSQPDAKTPFNTYFFFFFFKRLFVILSPADRAPPWLISYSSMALRSAVPYTSQAQTVFDLAAGGWGSFKAGSPPPPGVAPPGAIPDFRSHLSPHGQPACSASCGLTPASVPACQRALTAGTLKANDNDRFQDHLLSSWPAIRLPSATRRGRYLTIRVRIE